MEFISTKMVLKMISAEMRPVQNYVKPEGGGKGKWEKDPSGREEKYYEIICVTDDEFNEKVIFNTKVDFTKLEGKKVIAHIAWNYDNFNKRMGSPKLESLVAA